MWGGFFVRSGPQQAHGKQGINYAAKKNTPLSSHLLFPNLGHVIFSREFFADLYMAERRFTLVLLASVVKTGSIKHKR